MKTKKKLLIACMIMVLFLMITGCSHQDLSTKDTFPNVDNSDETGEDTIMIRSREAARKTMEKFLEEKYGDTYIVNLPGQNESGDYIATAYLKNVADSQLEVGVNPITGICRDNKCIKTIEKTLTEAVQDQANAVWEDVIVEVYCQFGNDVPDYDWDDASPVEEIISKEDVNGGIYVMIREENIEFEEEAKQIRKLLKPEVLDGFLCELDVYYVSDDIYSDSEDLIREGKSILQVPASKDYSHYMRMFVKIDTNQDYLEDIQDGFRS